MKNDLQRLLFGFLLFLFWNTPFLTAQCDFTVSATATPSIICEPTAVQLQATINGVTPSPVVYQWSPTGGLSNPFAPDPTVTLASTTTFSVTATALSSQNLITNGDFESGNTGFTTGYTVGTGGAWGPVSNVGTFLITTNPTLAHSNFATCADHSATGVNMFVANGAASTTTNVWCQTVTVQPNTLYVFSMWAMSAVADNPAILFVQINGNNVGGTMNLTNLSCVWQQHTFTWNSGNSTSANFCIRNQNIAGPGNDFAIDDISLTPNCTASTTVTVTRENVPLTFQTERICEGDSLFVGGGWQTQTSTYYDTLASLNGCDSVIVTSLVVRPLPVLSLGNDTSICSDATLLLQLNLANVTYEWQDGSTASTFTALPNGTYSVTVTDANGCKNRDSIMVGSTPLPIVELGNDTTLCDGDELVLRTTQSSLLADYFWQDGSTAPTYVARTPGGTYSVTVTEGNCTASDAVVVNYEACDCYVALPTAFTPNPNGQNDEFAPIIDLACTFSNYSFKVYNRWGQLIFSTTDPSQFWDGSFDGAQQPQDTYVWVLEYTLNGRFSNETVARRGDVLLLR